MQQIVRGQLDLLVPPFRGPVVPVDAEVSRLSVTCGQITTTARAAARVPMARDRLYSGHRHALFSRSRTCHCRGCCRAVMLLVVIACPRLLLLLRFRVALPDRRLSLAAMPAAVGFR